MLRQTSIPVIYSLCLCMIFALTEYTASIKENAVQLKIVNGISARRGKWPWQALLLIKKGDSVILCGGTLVHPEWVLTAAHCAVGSAKMKIFFGVWNVSSLNERGRVLRTDKSIHIHPCYDDDLGTELSGVNLALVRLKNKVVQFRPVCFQNNHNWRELQKGEVLGSCIATGYGVVDTGRRANVLQQVEFSHTSMKSCKIYGKTYQDKTICAHDKIHTGRDACTGDMGGPLLCPTAHSDCGGYYLTAVTIAGNTPCGGDISSRPGLYAAVDPNLDWIHSVMRGHKNATKPRGTTTAYFCNTKTGTIKLGSAQNKKMVLPSMSPGTLGSDMTNIS